MLDYKVHCTYNNVNVKIQYNTWFCAKKVPKKMDAHSSISKQRFIEVSKNKYKAAASILYWPTMHQLLIFKSFQGLFDKDVPHWLAKGPQKSPEAGFSDLDMSFFRIFWIPQNAKTNIGFFAKNAKMANPKIVKNSHKKFQNK